MGRWARERKDQRRNSKQACRERENGVKYSAAQGQVGREGGREGGRGNALHYICCGRRTAGQHAMHRDIAESQRYKMPYLHRPVLFLANAAACHAALQVDGVDEDARVMSRMV
jgi:hypothetical protein